MGDTGEARGLGERGWLALATMVVALGCGEEERPPFAPPPISERSDSGASRALLDAPQRSGTSSSSSRPDDERAEAGESCDRDSDCKSGATCFQGTCVGEGDLRFSLSWELDTDLDLHVETPSGTEIYYGNPLAAGGELDVDDCVGSLCREPGDTHVENIFWAVSPPTGRYTFWVHNYAEEFLADFEIEVSRAGTTRLTEAGRVPLTPPFESARFSFTY